MTTFAAQCEECHRDRAWPPVVIRGALCEEADVGFVTCWRGHRVRVRRMPRARVDAMPVGDGISVGDALPVGSGLVDAGRANTVRPSEKTVRT